MPYRRYENWHARCKTNRVAKCVYNGPGGSVAKRTGMHWWECKSQGVQLRSCESVTRRCTRHFDDSFGGHKSVRRSVSSAAAAARRRSDFPRRPSKLFAEWTRHRSSDLPCCWRSSALLRPPAHQLDATLARFVIRVDSTKVEQGLGRGFTFSATAARLIHC
jgi:hypothetical protein